MKINRPPSKISNIKKVTVSNTFPYDVFKFLYNDNFYYFEHHDDKVKFVASDEVIKFLKSKKIPYKTNNDGNVWVSSVYFDIPSEQKQRNFF